MKETRFAKKSFNARITLLDNLTEGCSMISVPGPRSKTMAILRQRLQRVLMPDHLYYGTTSDMEELGLEEKFSMEEA